MSDSSTITDSIEHGTSAYGQYKRMSTQVIFPDVLHDCLNYSRFIFTAFTPVNSEQRSAQLHDLPVRLGVAFNLMAKGRVAGQNPGVNETKYLMTLFPSSQQYRDQERIRCLENISAKKNWKGISDAELLFNRLHGRS
jgi:hypothetical protein